MVFKRYTATNLAAPHAEQGAPEPKSEENRFPSILRGRGIEQLELTRETIEAIAQNRIARSGRVIKASNLAKVRAHIKGMKSTNVEFG